jgi:hypothetical protein
MRHLFLALAASSAVAAMVSVVAIAAPNSLADYPLRVHVYEQQWHKHPNGSVEGNGRANLFEQGRPRGFDYSFNCPELFRSSMGWETYPAKWRGKDGELEMLVPVMGKAGERRQCILKVVMKEGAYYKHNGQLNEEPAPVFKEWMQKHQYDPEHGKNQPIGLSSSHDGGTKSN